MSCDNVCPDLEIAWKTEEQWCVSRISPTQLREKSFQPNSVVFIFASGDKIRSCDTCGTHFRRTFQVPRIWWSTFCRRANGYFGSEEKFDESGELEAHSLLEDDKDYVWYKFNIFTHWAAQTKTTYVLVFDPRPEVKELIEGSFHTPHKNSRDTYKKKPDIDVIEIKQDETFRERVNGHIILEKEPLSLSSESAKVSKTPRGLKPSRLLDRITEQSLINPYAIHTLFMEDVVYQLEESVWGIRDRLRDVELQRTSKEDPNPNYESIHDVARHAIHVSETIDAAVSTIISIKAEHDHFRKILDAKDRTGAIEGNRVRRCLDFSESMLRNLRFRSSSNMTRLQNEIQLAFNVVSQQIGRSAKADSNAMLGIALLTMLFLPPTFMSGIFSTSFFDFDSEHDRWAWSSKFWIYWAFTLPITLVSLLVFCGFYVINHPAQAGSLTQIEEKVKLKNLLLLWRAREKLSQPSPA